MEQGDPKHKTQGCKKSRVPSHCDEKKILLIFMVVPQIFVRFQHGNIFIRVFLGPEILSSILRISKNFCAFHLGDYRLVSHRLPISLFTVTLPPHTALSQVPTVSLRKPTNNPETTEKYCSFQTFSLLLM
jgi:hypothetical protein